MGEIGKILAAQDRTIEPKTFDAYGVRASELAAKVGEYNGMLGRGQIEHQSRSTCSPSRS